MTTNDINLNNTIQYQSQIAKRNNVTTQQVEQKIQSNTDDQKVIPNVVSKSQDGDTVQVNTNAIQALEKDNKTNVANIDKQNYSTNKDLIKKDDEKENIVLDNNKSNQQINEEEQKKAEQKRKIQAELKKEIEKEKKEEAQKQQEEQKENVQISSFAGYSDSDLEQMWRSGKISKAEYDKEIKKRENEEQNKLDESKQFSNTMSNVNSAENQNQLNNIEQKALFNEDASKTLSAKNRSDIMNAVNDNKQEDKDKIVFREIV